ncbi:hypothetical protein ACJ2YB_000088 [Cronobacter sakazakii]
MNQWFMSYKIYFSNGGILENFDFYSADASKSGADVAKECAELLAQQHNVEFNQIMYVSFNRV